LRFAPRDIYLGELNPKSGAEAALHIVPLRRSFRGDRER
jgi:hypothetical protein